MQFLKKENIFFACAYTARETTFFKVSRIGGMKMLVRLPSMTSAVRLRQRLMAEEIPSQVVQSPARLQKKGCSYALEIQKEHLGAVKKAAEGLGIQMMGVYE